MLLWYWSHFVVLLKSDLDVERTHPQKPLILRCILLILSSVTCKIQAKSKSLKKFNNLISIFFSCLLHFQNFCLLLAPSTKKVDQKKPISFSTLTLVAMGGCWTKKPHILRCILLILSFVTCKIQAKSKSLKKFNNLISIFFLVCSTFKTSVFFWHLQPKKWIKKNLFLSPL